MGIGELLQSEREKKGLSLNDVENATKIRSRYIQALETENFDDHSRRGLPAGFSEELCQAAGPGPGSHDRPVINQYIERNLTMKMTG